MPLEPDPSIKSEVPVNKNKLKFFIETTVPYMEETYARLIQQDGSIEAMQEFLREVQMFRNQVGSQFGDVSVLIQRKMERLGTLAGIISAALFLKDQVSVEERVLQKMPLFGDILAHGIVKNVMYDGTHDELYKKLALLSAHAYEPPRPQLGRPDMAADFYERVDPVEYADRIQTLRATPMVSVRDSETIRQTDEETITHEHALIEEFNAILSQYEKEVSIDVLWGGFQALVAEAKTLLASVEES